MVEPVSNKAYGTEEHTAQNVERAANERSELQTAENLDSKEPGAGFETGTEKTTYESAYEKVVRWSESLGQFHVVDPLASIALHQTIQAVAGRRGVEEHNETTVYWGSLLSSASIVALGRAFFDGNYAARDMAVGFAWNIGANIASDAVLYMGKYACSCLSNSK